MTSKSFTVQMEAFRDKTKPKMRAVLSASVQDIVEIAQTPVAQGGRMPVDTGALRNSLTSELNGAKLAQGPTSYTLAAATIEPGDVARFGWTAAHALPQHEGRTIQKNDGTTKEIAGRHWVDGAAAEWPAIVARNTARLK